MAFPTKDANSTQYAKIVSQDHDPLEANEQGGRIRAAFFSLTTGTQLDGYVWYLNRIPKGARLLGGEMTIFTDPEDSDFVFRMVNKQGSATVEGTNALGVASTFDFSSLSYGTAGTAAGGVALYTFTGGLYYGAVVDEEVVVTMEVETDDMAAGTDVVGFIRYVVD